MKKKNIIITFAFLLYIAIFSIGSIVMKDRDFSDMENRNLAKFPEVSAASIAKGDFMDGFETYMADQIILKDELVKLNTSLDYISNERLINNVIFADNDMIIQNYTYDENQLSKNISSVNEFALSNPDFTYTWLVAPTASYIYKDKLPDNSPCDNQKMAMNYMNENVSDVVKLSFCDNKLEENKAQYIFYNTDHHWTQNGAFYGYETLCEALGIQAMSKDDYEINEPSKAFYGSLYSKAPMYEAKPDTVFLYENEKGRYHVDYLDEGWSEDSLYHYENLMIKDKYTTFLDGNHSLIKITSNAEDKEPVLVIKDSYAHSLLPFLSDNYGEIHVIDLRYYHQSVSEYAKENGIKKIIFINNLDFVTTDNNFLWLY